ncbi:unnamed protein product [Soboliphyme baturini]|uniref:Chromo domain-containing protein n=1 Tax=Soboliphyme baturini TaxID=241478 RepID=A0A183JAA9_9BILA|nr:unnamed protein product [Soboliphyme baturini]
MSKCASFEKEYEVERIISCRKKHGVIKFLIKWKDYPNSANTWEPLENLNCPGLIEEFKRTWKAKLTDNSFHKSSISGSPSKRACRTNLEQDDHSKSVESNRTLTDIIGLQEERGFHYSLVFFLFYICSIYIFA